MYFAKIFSQPVVYLLIFLKVFHRSEVFNFTEIQQAIFTFIDYAFSVVSKHHQTKAQYSIFFKW